MCSTHKFLGGVRLRWSDSIRALGALVPNCIYNNNKLGKLFQIMKVFGHLMIHWAEGGGGTGSRTFIQKPKCCGQCRSYRSYFVKPSTHLIGLKRRRKKKDCRRNFLRCGSPRQSKRRARLMFGVFGSPSRMNLTFFVTKKLNPSRCFAESLNWKF